MSQLFFTDEERAIWHDLEIGKPASSLAQFDVIQTRQTVAGSSNLGNNKAHLRLLLLPSIGEIKKVGQDDAPKEDEAPIEKYLVPPDSVVPGDVVRIWHPDKSKPVVLVYMGMDRFPHLDEAVAGKGDKYKYPFFAYQYQHPMLKQMQYNTFPPRFHKALVDIYEAQVAESVSSENIKRIIGERFDAVEYTSMKSSEEEQENDFRRPLIRLRPWLKTPLFSYEFRKQRGRGNGVFVMPSYVPTSYWTDKTEFEVLRRNPFSPSLEQRPEAVIVMIHGVFSGAQGFKYFKRNVHGGLELPKSRIWLLGVDWGSQLPHLASDSVGSRANSNFGMHDLAWVGVAKLKEAVARCREMLPDTPIVLLGHSQGTIVSCAALAEGMKVDNWILMGSPLELKDAFLGIDGSLEAKEAELFSKATANVRGKIVNVWSNQPGPFIGLPAGWTGPEGDFWAWLKDGIGERGLPTELISTRVTNLEIEGVDHFAGGDWWEMEWLRCSNKKAWHGMSRASFISVLTARNLVSSTTQVNGLAIQSQFELLNEWASTKVEVDGLQQGLFGARVSNASGNGYQEWYSNRDDHNVTHTFTLTKDMVNGFYSEDKDEAFYDVTCIEGTVQCRMSWAIGSVFDSHTTWKTINAGDDEPATDQVKIPGIQDATIYFQIKALTPIAKAKCMFKASDPIIQ